MRCGIKGIRTGSQFKETLGREKNPGEAREGGGESEESFWFSDMQIMRAKEQSKA